MPDLIINNMDVEVVQKNIKNVHLSVNPPVGHIRVSAPEHMSMDAIKAYVISKLNWIKKQQYRFKTQDREALREYIDKESHYFNGKCYLLKVEECDAHPKVQLNHSQIILQVHPGSDIHKKAAVLDNWYRNQLREKTFPMIKAWEKKMEVSVSKLTIQKMKTKWGSCNPLLRSIRINLELAKKPSDFLEYVVVHELTHLIEPSHNHRFKELMDKFMPKWRFYKDELNRLPLGHTE